MTTTQTAKKNTMDYAKKCGLALTFVLSCAFDAEQALMSDNYNGALAALESRGLTELASELRYMIRRYDLA